MILLLQIAGQHAAIYQKIWPTGMSCWKFQEVAVFGGKARVMDVINKTMADLRIVRAESKLLGTRGSAPTVQFTSGQDQPGSERRCLKPQHLPYLAKQRRIRTDGLDPAPACDGTRITTINPAVTPASQQRDALFAVSIHSRVPVERNFSASLSDVVVGGFVRRIGQCLALNPPEQLLNAPIPTGVLALLTRPVKSRN